MVSGKDRVALIVALALACAPLAAQQRRPIVGKVSEIGAEGVVVDVGRNDGVREGTEFEVWRPQRVVYLPLSGRKGKQILVEKKVIARLVTRRALADTSVCSILSGKADELKAEMARSELTVVEVEPVLKRAANVRPYIDTLTASPQRMVPSQQARIVCKVVDADDDRHVYRWSTNGGSLRPEVSLDGRCVWTAPSAPGRYTVTVEVWDPKGGVARSSVALQVLKPSREPVGYRIDAVFGYTRPAFLQASAVAFDESGNTLLVDGRQRKVVFFDRDGVPLRVSLPYAEKHRFVDILVSGGRYYLVDAAYNSVWVYDSRDAIFKANPVLKIGVRGTGNGAFAAPPRPAVAPDGRLFMLDPLQGYIQIYAADGTFLYGIGHRGADETGFRQPVALGFDRTGLLYVLDRARKRIFVLKGHTVTGSVPLQKKLVDPVDMAVDPSSGNLIVLDRGASCVRVISPSGRTLVTFGRKGGLAALSEPSSLAYHPGGFVYVICDKGKVIRRYRVDGSFMGVKGLVKLWPLSDMAVAPDGGFYVAFGEQKIARLSDDGWVVSVFGGYGTKEGRFVQPAAMACDGEGNLYVADAGTLKISKFNRFGEFMGRFGSASSERQRRVDSIVDLYVRKGSVFLLQDRGTYFVQVFGKDGRMNAWYPSSEGRIDDPVQLAVDDAGNTYVYNYDAEIYRFDSGGLRVGGRIRLRSSLADMLVDQHGSIVALDAYEPKIVRINPASGVRRKFRLPSRFFTAPCRIGLDSAGRLFILDTETGLVVRLVPTYGG